MKTNSLAPHVGALRVVLALAMAGSCVFAQAEQKNKQSTAAPAAEETELPPVTVSAHEGIAVPYDQTGVSVTILDSKQLQKEGVQTLNEALTRAPGVFSMPGGSTYQRGSVSYISIRGMNSDDYTLTMIDGMRLYHAGSLAGAVQRGTQNLFSLGNIEVVKGPEGAVYGNGAIGGVVATETPQGQGEPSVRIFNEGGSYDSYMGHILAQGAEGKWDYSLAAGYEHTNNDPYRANMIRERHSSRFTQWSEAVRLGYQINEDARVSVTYRRQDSDFATPQGIWQYNPEDFSSSLAGYGRVQDSYRTNLTTAKFEAKLNKLWTTSLMAGYFGYDFTENPSPATGLKPYDSNLRNVQIEWRNSLKWNEKNMTTAGFAWDRSQFMSEGAIYQNRNLENVYSLFAEHLYKPVASWDNSVALRLDHSTTWNNLLTYRYSTSWKVTGEQSKTRLFGSFGSGYRAPSQFERYAVGGRDSWGNTYTGNPDLDISKSLGGDLGVEQKIADAHFASLTGFWTRVNDQIQQVSVDPDNSWDTNKTYRNLSHATSVGLELALRGDFGDAWNTGYTLAYTYTVPKDNKDRQLTYTARIVWSADIHTSPVKNVTTGLGVLAANNRFDNTGRADNYCILRWYAQWQATKNLAFHIRVENMTNDKFITQNTSYGADSWTYSMGTAVYGGFTLTF